MRAIFKSSLLLLVLIGVSVVLYNYWPYIFARNVKGVISDVQRVSTPVAVMTGGGSAADTRDLFSFAVGIREDSGEIVTASSEDRQWAIAKSGQCAEAKFYPYPWHPMPWNSLGNGYRWKLIPHGSDWESMLDAE